MKRFENKYGIEKGLFLSIKSLWMQGLLYIFQNMKDKSLMLGQTNEFTLVHR